MSRVPTSWSATFGRWTSTAATSLLGALPPRLGDLASSERVRVHGASMAPFLLDGDLLLVSRAAYVRERPQRGDVALVRHPAEKRDDVKRIIGLPGDTIEVIGGAVRLHGVPLAEPYVQRGPLPPRAGLRDGAWELGQDAYFVLGDNRQASDDSRVYGPVERARLVGRVWYRYGPPGRVGPLPQATKGSL